MAGSRRYLTADTLAIKLLLNCIAEVAVLDQRKNLAAFRRLLRHVAPVHLSIVCFRTILPAVPGV
jgi:hypothetical protein